MRYTAVSREIGEETQARWNVTTSAQIKYYWCPRIKCLDCPREIYTVDPDLGVKNFEVHLKNRHHRDRVNKRIKKSWPSELMGQSSTNESHAAPLESPCGEIGRPMTPGAIAGSGNEEESTDESSIENGPDVSASLYQDSTSLKALGDTSGAGV